MPDEIVNLDSLYEADDHGEYRVVPLEDPEEKARRAEAKAASTEAEAQRARARLAEADVTLMSMEVDKYKAQLDTLEHELLVAADIGDYPKQASIHRKISETAVAKDNAERALNWRAQQAVKAQQQTASSDPVERWASTLSARSADCVRQNPEFASTERGRQKMLAGHYSAVADGHAVDSPEYFAAVSRHIGGRVDRSGSTDSGGSTRVRLTEREVAASEDGSVVYNVGSRHPRTGEIIRRGDPLVGQPIGRASSRGARSKCRSRAITIEEVPNEASAESRAHQGA
jgi:hypothetical protein